ncbi:MAG: PEP/pyruvate-binding domain-containing protein [Syntrophobacteraceae bacterium]|nr:PEP/pyruvate-binding domain-containing protein [Syntrophobacteraceae bacterium]
MARKGNPPFSSEDIRSTDLVRAYRVHEQILKYPHLMGEIRELFLSVLCERELVCGESIRGDALALLEALGEPSEERAIKEVTGILTDVYFAHHLSREDVENHINLVRKREAFRILTKLMNSEGATSARIRKAVKEFCAVPKGSLYIQPGESMGVRVGLLSRFISDQLPFLGVAKNHITIRDMDELMERIIRNPRREGRIGGKSAGMFLAYKIILPALGPIDPEFEKYVRIPESYYFTSGFLTDFLDTNDLFWLHSQKYKNLETIEEEFSQICETIERASFPSDVIAQFRDFLEQVGGHPLIIRSSSLLEDNVGFTFSGKYDSVFIANQGDLDTRTAEFTGALKQVLTSVFSPRAILYRKDHNLLDFDERMSILVQKVVGRRHGDYFFPTAAGVAYSQNMYAWTQRIVRSDGLLRLVFGLGTRAVDRIGPDYPRMVPLSHPLLRPEVSAEEIKKYSQRLVDVLELRSNSIVTIAATELFQSSGCPDLYYVVSAEKEGHLAPPLFKTENIDWFSGCVTFDNLLSKTPVAGLLKRILHQLEEAHGRPVEVEFAWDGGILYVLQCRALAVSGLVGKVSIPEAIEPQKVLFTCSSVLFSSAVKDIEYIVYVDPRAYAAISTFEERIAVGRTVGRINRLLAGKKYALFGPGRWGTNDVEMGVKVSYEDINRTKVLAEIAVRDIGARPEPSFGTHFFNDLVEANIVPLAIYADSPGTVFREDFFRDSPDGLAALDPHSPPEAIVRVINVPACTEGQYLQVYLDGELQKGVGFLSRFEGSHGGVGFNNLH